MPKSVLVAGGAGFIGSHTAKLLHQMGYEPVVLDNLVTGNRFAVRFGPFYEASIEEAAVVKSIVHAHGIGHAILLAGHAYVGESASEPRKYYTNNISNNLSFVNALLDSGVDRIVFSSSCSVYGAQPELPLAEDSPLAPLSPYAESKLVLERALAWYGRAYGSRSVCLRYFNAAGADPDGELGECHDPETHLIPLAILAGLTGRPFPVFGDDYPTPDGTCIRDYVHVTDLARAHVQALEYLAGDGGNSVINLGTGKGNSVLEVIREVERISGERVPFTMAPRRAGDAPILVADYAKATRLLGWKPRYSDLGTVVQTAWNWLSRRLQSPVSARSGSQSF